MFEIIALDYVSELPPQAAFHLGVLFTLAFEEKARKAIGAYHSRKNNTQSD